jgi:hypothetical protein
MVTRWHELAAVVSGGQTGVDRAALELGRRLGVAVGGWCPAGGWAEDLTDPPGLLVMYPELRPTPSDDPTQRTRWNVRDSHATLVLVRPGVSSPGTEATIALARNLARPHLVASVHDAGSVGPWLGALPPAIVLNVAGPRESEAPGIEAEALAVLLDALPG